MRGSFDGDGGQSESYFISFSDLLIGMIFLFIIILFGYALSFRVAEMEAEAELAQLVQERDQLAIERDQLEADKAQLQERTLALEAVAEELLMREQLRDRMLEELAQGLANRGIDVVLDLEKGVLRLPETLLFASASATLTERGEAALQDLADVMAEVMPCYVAVAETICGNIKRSIVEAVLIEGHTDNLPIRSPEFRDNWDLSVARGVNTYKALTATDDGLDAMRNGRAEAVLGVSGYETRRPVASNATAVDRERNRRIDLRFLIAAPTAKERESLDPLNSQPDPVQP